MICEVEIEKIFRPLNCELEIEERFRPYLIGRRKRVQTGVEYIFKFPNRYGVSVEKHFLSFGHEDDLWEVTLLWMVDDEFVLAIPNSTIGYLNDAEVNKLLEKYMNKQRDEHVKLKRNRP